MGTFALNTFPKRLLVTVTIATLLMVVPKSKAQDDDPPAQAGRISSISGNVSIQPVGTQDWGQAYPNLTIGPGDRIFTDSDGRAEVQVGQSYLRIGANSDVTLVDDTQFQITFGVAQGAVHLHTYGLWPRQLMAISTPNGNAEFENSGDMRVDVYPQDGATVFTNYGNFADVTGAGDYRQELDNGQSLQLSGSNPVYPQWLQPAGGDDLDSWSEQRDQQLSRVASYQYVSPDIPGAADLDSYGDWQPDTEYGPVWFPRSVSADWAPYHYGHWVNRQPWGWVWVEDEPWGYAPFHYGRWVSYRGRWGWIPGAPTARPVWSPALVAFAGGISFGGGGISVWFPLGPGEAYRPWYRCSDRYIDRVNISNIRESRDIHVRTTYVNVVNVTNVTYVNQSRGYTAMRHDDFASGRSARNSNVRVDPREMERARTIARPDVTPTQQSVITRPTAHPVRVSSDRPRLINQKGQQFVAQPGATPVAPPIRANPQPKQLPGRVVIAQPAPSQGGNRNQSGRQMPPGQDRQGRQDQRGNQPPATNPGGQIRPSPQPPVQPTGRPQPGQPVRQDNNPSQPSQPPITNPGGQIRPTPQQPVPPSQRPNQPFRPDNNPNQPPAVNPGGQPRPTPEQPAQPSDRPNQQNGGQQDRNQYRPPQGNPGGQPRPTPQQPVQPSDRPVTPNPGQQDRNQYRPPQANPGGQPRPTPQQPVQPSDRPVPPNGVPQERERYQPPQARPNTPPPAQPAPPQQRNESRPVPPPQDRPQARPQPPQDRPQARPEPPPQSRPEARPVPPPQNRPDARPAPPPNRQEQPRRDEKKKEDKKDEKKPS